MDLMYYFNEESKAEIIQHETVENVRNIVREALDQDSAKRSDYGEYFSNKVDEFVKEVEVDLQTND